MLQNDRINKLDEKKEKLEQELVQVRDKKNKLEERERKLEEEVTRCKEQKAALEMQEIKASLGKNGLDLNDVITAITNGDLVSLQTKMKEHKSKIE